MDSLIEEKIINFRQFLSSIVEDASVKLILNLFDNETLYNMFHDIYLKSNITPEQAFDELTGRLKLNEVSDEDKCKIKRYIEYFDNYMKIKYGNMDYDELLKSLK